MPFLPTAWAAIHRDETEIWVQDAIQDYVETVFQLRCGAARHVIA
jgi:hypothetical protein